MHHAKTDSEVTSSMAPSSPPARAAYYVQSPSHDDGEHKTTAASSFHSSPAASPPRSLGNHSRESSSSRFSGKVLPSSAAHGGGFAALPKKVRYGLGFVGAFFALFFFFALILWGASRNQKPVVSLNSVTFHNFVIQAGTDASLVPTELSTINATVKLTFRNTGTFFGVHVTAQPVTLYYSQLLMASGNMKYFYQPRKSQRNVAVTVVGSKVPLYGGGAGLSSTPGPKGAPPPPVPLQLTVRIRARALVLGKLVKPKFYSDFQCSLRLDVAKLGKPVSLKKSCTHV